MSKELKILLIAGGTLVGLILIVGIAGLLALPRLIGGLAHSTSDPKNVAAVNAKIANFRVPPGYVETNAFNVLFTSMAMIEPATVVPRRRFYIQLQAISVPTGALSKEQSEQQLLTGVKMGLASRCGSFHETGGETISVRGVPVDFKVVECDLSGGKTLRAEVGNFAANAPYVTLLAVGPADTFDEKALHALLASIR